LKLLILRFLGAFVSLCTLQRYRRVDPTPPPCTTSGSYVNKRCSAFNASVAAGISQTGGLVQSSLYSYAVLFHCLE